MVLRWLRAEEAGEDMGSGGGGRFGFLAADGFEARDVLAQGVQLVGLLHLARLLAQAEGEELLAGLAELGGDLGRGEVADFFRGHRAEMGRWWRIRPRLPRGR